jgi:large subunit ribosomal protein L15
MMIHDITSKVGKHQSRKRVGRGHGSGLGKTSGRGHKGAGSRSGYSRKPSFEGGQMTWTRRIPKRGFTNNPFRKHYHVVNLRLLEERVEDGADVTVEVLSNLGVVRDANLPLKILADGEITKKFNVTAAKLSKAAIVKIEAAGGSVTEIPSKKWVRTKKA